MNNPKREIEPAPLPVKPEIDPHPEPGKTEVDTGDLDREEINLDPDRKEEER